MKGPDEAGVQPGVSFEPLDVATAEALRALPVPEHGAGFWSDLQDRLDADERRRAERSGRRAYRYVGLVGMVFVTLVAAAVTLAGGGAREADVTTVPAPTDVPRWRATASWLAARRQAGAAWTGQVLFVWGGAGAGGTALADGGAYDPLADRWTAVPASPLSARSGATAVWTGSEVVVWGGVDGSARVFDDGAAYDPQTGRWTALPPAPLEARAGHVAAWTRRQMLVWGGRGEGERWFADGAAYDPVARRWTPLPPAPLEARDGHTAVWTGRELLVWGGRAGEEGAPLADGAAYDPERGRWTPLPASPVAARDGHTAVWTGRRMLVWGGLAAAADGGPSADGAAYDPGRGRWTLLPPTSLAPRFDHRAVWTGQRMLVWGGGPPEAADGASYDPDNGRWASLPAGPLAGRTGHVATWTGDRLLVWGGGDAEQPLADGATLTGV